MATLKKILTAGVLAVSLSGAASAATLSFDGVPSEVGKMLGGTFATAIGSSSFEGTTGGLAAGDLVDVYSGSSNIGGLRINGAGKLRITLLGFEAAATSSVFDLLAGGATLLKSIPNIGMSIVTGAVGNAFVPFGFGTSGGIAGTINNGDGSTDSRLKIAFGAISADRKSVIALFDDGRRGNDEPDLDDMIVRVEVVPVPAAGFMLLGALGGLAALRRRRKGA
jgi:hypothetical protein